MKAAIRWVWSLGFVASMFYVVSFVFQAVGMVTLSAGVALAGMAIVISMLIAGAFV